jgi:hypothetical protein
MSGYLQRMVASARRPERAIHPIVGSLYAAPDFGRPAESFGIHEELLVSVSPALAYRPPQETGRPEVDRKPAGADELSGEVLMKPSAADRTTEVPRAPHEEVRGSPEVMSLPPQVAGAPRHTPTATAGTQRSTATPSALRGPTAIESPEPLFGPMQAAANPPIESSRSAPPSLRPPAQPRIAAPGRSFPAAVRQNDQIEIHIGRIEVKAVPPAARPAPQRERKALNLDEYLKRGSRR